MQTRPRSIFGSPPASSPAGKWHSAFLGTTAAALPSSLREGLRLMDDPLLRDPTRVPWTAMGFCTVALLAIVLAVLVLKRRRARTPVAAPAVPEPVEDALAALAAARAGGWDAVRMLEAMSAVLRRFLGRGLRRDVTTLTTGELARICEGEEAAPARMFPMARVLFFAPADLVRFAGRPAGAAELEELYQAACAYVRACESDASSSGSSADPTRPAGSALEFKGNGRLLEQGS